MARDDFSRPVIERLSKRAGMKCSNPECRRPTAGPDAQGGVTNLGVAAHITAASAGGPRYDDTLTSDARSAIANGIWLCQDHAKLVDDDELRFPASLLREWKETAEHMAALEARGYAVRRASLFPELERKLPKLIEEMRVDLIGKPLTREFIIMSKHWTYNAGRTPLFQYLLEDHDQLLSAMTIMVHYGAIYSIKYNNVDRYNFTENFVSYLVGDNA
jgi:hypothetical protein